MARKKKYTLVKDVLSLMHPDDKVYITWYAYDIPCAYSQRDGFMTAGQCLEHCGYDYLNAAVGRLLGYKDALAISAEVIHD